MGSNELENSPRQAFIGGSGELELIDGLEFEPENARTLGCPITTSGSSHLIREKPTLTESCSPVRQWPIGITSSRFDLWRYRKTEVAKNPFFLLGFRASPTGFCISMGHLK